MVISRILCQKCSLPLLCRPPVLSAIPGSVYRADIPDLDIVKFKISRHSFYLFCNFLSTVLIQYSFLVTGWHACCCAGKNLHRRFPAPGFFLGWTKGSVHAGGIWTGAAVQQPGTLTTLAMPHPSIASFKFLEKMQTKEVFSLCPLLTVSFRGAMTQEKENNEAPMDSSFCRPELNIKYLLFFEFKIN